MGACSKSKEIQTAKRGRFPSPQFAAQDFLSAFPFYLTRQKVTEMIPEEFLELLQVAILAACTGEVSFAVLFPSREKLLQGVPLPNKDFALLFGSNGGVGLEQLR